MEMLFQVPCKLDVDAVFAFIPAFLLLSQHLACALGTGVQADFRFSLALQEIKEWKGQSKGHWRLRNGMGRGQQNTL